MNRNLALIAASLLIALAPAAALACPVVVLPSPTPVVSSSAQEVPDPAGDAVQDADIVAFSLLQDRTTITYGFTLAPGADPMSQQLQVCATSSRQVVCIHDPSHVRVAGRVIPARIRSTGSRVSVNVSAARLGYPTARRTVSARAKVGLMMSRCPISCSDVGPVAVSSISM